MLVEQFFYEHPVFRIEEFTAFESKFKLLKSHSVKGFLALLVQNGRLKLIRNALYALVPNVSLGAPAIVDPYLIAGKATQDAIIGYRSALEFYGVIPAGVNRYTFGTAMNHLPFEFDGVFYRPVSIPMPLQRKQSAQIFVETISRQGVSLKITNPARTFVDVLDRVDLCGGWQEIYPAITKLAINVDEVVNYCLLINKCCLSAKVGYFLSQLREVFAVEENHLKSLQAKKPKGSRYVSRITNDKFQSVKEWNIFLPESVITESWQGGKPKGQIVEEVYRLLEAFQGT